MKDENTREDQLVKAAVNNNLIKVRMLIAEGINVNAVGNVTVAVTGAKNLNMLLDNLTALMWAAQQGHTKIVQILLNAGADVHMTIPSPTFWAGQNSLMMAAENGHAQTTKILLNAGANIHVTDNNGRNALIFTAKKGHTAVAIMLLDSGANPYEEDDNGLTALMIATDNKYTEMVEALKKYEQRQKQLLEREQEIMATCPKITVDTPLLPEVYVDLKILDAERKFNEKDYYTAAELMKFVRCYSEQNDVALPLEFDFKNAKILTLAKLNVAAKDSIMRYLKERGRKGKNYQEALQMFEKLADSRHHVDMLPLIRAAHDGDLAKVKNLIAKDSDVNATSNKGVTSLMRAAQIGNIEIAKILMGAGANVNAKDNNNWTALMWATKYRYAKVVKMLLDAGANVNTKDDNKTALVIAVRNEIIEVTRILLDAGANVNAKNNGETLLMQAAWSGNIELTKILLDAGANVNAENNEGETALISAAFWGNAETVKIFLDAGANINAEDNNTLSALMYAAQYGNVKIVKMLLDAGADIHIKEHYSNETVLMIAARGPEDEDEDEVHAGHVEVAKILLDAGVDIQAKTKEGKTALDLAKPEVAALIKQYISKS